MMTNTHRILSKFQSRKKRLQRCSKCKSTGHNSRNKNCPVNLDLSDMIEDAVEEDDEPEEVENIQNQDEEDLVDVDELLDSDDDLF